MGLGRVAYGFAATTAHLFPSVLPTERQEPANDSKSLQFFHLVVLLKK